MSSVVDAFDMDPKEAISDEEQSRLQNLCEEAVQMKQIVDDMEESLKVAKKGLNDIITKKLPDLMVELGFGNGDSINKSGFKIVLRDFVSGSLPKDPDKKEQAIKWLQENDGGDIIKSTVTLAFEKSQHNEALALVDDLKAKGHETELVESVHAQTLQAFARERIKKGDSIDTEALGLFTGRVAKLTKS
jgi:hypothetical protein